MATFLLVRHGYTDWIETETLHGISDRPLSAVGLQQAQATADYLKDSAIERLYTSPLLRASQTADIIAAATGVQAVTVPEFREEKFGWLEGKRDWWSAVRKSRFLSWVYIYGRAVVGTLTGEPFWQFDRRVAQAWETLKSENPSGIIALVAHYGVLRAILAHEFGGSRFNPDSYTLSACSVSRISINGSGPKLISINENSHLPGEDLL